MRPISAAGLLTVTTLAPGRASRLSSSNPVRAKWPRWLVPNCISKPSAVSLRGMAITPALLTRMSRPSCSVEKSVANFPADARRGGGEPVEPHIGGGHRLADAFEGVAALGPVPAGENDMGAGPGQRQGRLESQAAVGPGHDGSVASQVRYVLFCPRCHDQELYAGRSGTSRCSSPTSLPPLTGATRRNRSRSNRRALGCQARGGRLP